MTCKLYMLARVGNCPDRVEGWNLRRYLVRDVMRLSASNMRHHVGKVVQNDAGRNSEVVGSRLRLEATTEGCREFVHVHLRD